MLLLFSSMQPRKMPRSADQNTCIMCAGLDDLLVCKFARGFVVISIGCSIIAIVQGSLHDLNTSHFAFMAAGAATTGYVTTCYLRQTCDGFHRPQAR
ncbi:hypothetical protein CEP54_001963 [Fusarium duplospermum]|uniref:Uncharacterized protein n=1 Tax=Fusarium duplospermum TaxID=1325734 RepID=A0A428QXC5_9HYPO|nr:hypothetical protein CEP54_001963 [Fusarium duplospermum]